MRVVHVDPERGFSGGEVQVFLLMRGLRARGHECVLVGQPGAAALRAAEAEGFETHGLPMRNGFDGRAVRGLTRFLRQRRSDLVHAHTGRANWIAGRAARRVRLPVVSTRRMDRRVKRGPLTRLLYGRLLAHTAAISPAVLARLHAAGVSEERSSLVWSVVDPARLVPRHTRAEVRRELGVEGSVPVLLAAGVQVRRKGFDLLLRALALLPDGTRLWLAGEGPESAALRTLVRELCLEHRVSLLGHRDDMPDLLQAADLFVMPSRAEGLGVAALEAMAAGRCVVAARVGGLGEAVLHERTGLLVEPENVSDLAESLQALLTDRARLDRYGAAGSERIAEAFLPEHMIRAYESIYERVLEREASA